MSAATNRRRFLQATAAGGALFGSSQFAFLKNLPPVSAAEARQSRYAPGVGPEIEPMVRLLEETPRDELLETVAAKIKSGTSYREIIAALQLAAVRNVEPRPIVGFKFHAVLVVNSAHLASLSSPASDRWLPIFWAIDYFKAKQIEEQRRNGWTLPPVDEAAVPPSHKAREAFRTAMENWDEEAADAAIAGLVRSAGANDVYGMLHHYGGRDFRSIGHKAIFTSNSQRTLSCIGWQRAEPVLRSLVYAMLNHPREPNPATSDLEADRPFRRNQELIHSIRDEWQDGQASDEATRELLAVFHSGANDEACDLAVECLNRGVAPQSIWDAVFIGAAELQLRQPGIVALHALTTTNALRHAYDASSDDASRRLTLLQNCAFVPMFCQEVKHRGKASDTNVDELKPVAPNETTAEGAVEEIFADLSNDRFTAAAKARSYLETGGSAKTLIDAARRLIFLKGREVHDYKFSSAVLEDYYRVSPQWQSAFLSMCTVNLRGSGQSDNGLVDRIHSALA